MKAVADQKQRQLALDPTRSFAVSAPAGSGKTGLLTQRVLKLLSLVDQPEEILCLTFTRKAAGEMQHRISEALESAANSYTEPDNDYEAVTWQLAKAALQRDQQKNWQLLKSPNRLRINTIDGFFRNLAQQLATESGIGDFAEPLEQPQIHYQQVIAGFVLEQLQDNGPWANDIATLLQHLDNNLNKLQELLSGLLEKREQWLHHLFNVRESRDYLEHFLQETITETLYAIEESLQPIASDLAILADYAASVLDKEGKPNPLAPCLGMKALPECSPDTAPQWLAMVHLLATADASNPDWRSDRGINIRLGFPTAKADPEFGDLRKNQLKEVLAWCREQSGLLQTLLDIRYLPISDYSDQQWQVLNALTNLLPALAAQLKLSFQQQGCSDFTEITLAALQALGSQALCSEDQPTDIALRLDYKIRHILVDEFQDTSSIQFEILRHLTSEWIPGDGRSLFIVGDGMQSLYGFRNANVGLFLEARQQPIGNIQLQPLDLSVNFRSQAGVIDWVNEAFNKAFPQQENIGRGAVCYSEAIAFHPASDNSAVSIDLFMDHTDDEAEAKQVVKLIREAKQQRPDGSIALLVRNRSHLRLILKSLAAANISWQASEIDPLKNQMPVIDLMSLTRALLSPADRIAWLSILRAPWCGLDLHDLYHLANAAVTESSTENHYPLLLTQILSHREIPAISPQGQQILGRVSGILKMAWQQRHRQPLRRWVENTWIVLGGPDVLKNSADMEYCQQYFDFLEQQSPINDWMAFHQSLEKLYGTANPDADPNLHVMTIHKAKGLEFDTVIIPGLHRSSRGNQQELLLWRERIAQDGHPQLLIAPLQGSGQDKEPLYRHLQYEAKLKEQLESTRVLYVGATRAIHQLHLLGRLKSGKKPANDSLLARLWPWMDKALKNDHPSIRLHPCPPENQQAEDTLNSYSHLWRLPPEWKSSSNNAEAIADSSIVNPASTPTVFNVESVLARHTGTLLHRVLRQITLEGISHWDSTRIEQQTPQWAAQLRQLGISETGSAIKVLQQAVAEILADSDNHWLLDNSHEDSQCEYALGYLDDNQQPRTAIIDRTFVSNGERWIVDYKSSQPEDNESLEQFLQHQKNQYSAQLQRYGELMQKLHKGEKQTLPVKLALYFPLCKYLEVIN